MLRILQEEVIFAGKQIVKQSARNANRAVVSAADGENGIRIFSSPNVRIDKQTVDSLLTLDKDQCGKYIGYLSILDYKLHNRIYEKYPEIGSIVTYCGPYTEKIFLQGKDIPVYGRYHAENFPGPIVCTDEIDVSGNDYQDMLIDSVLEAISKSDTSEPGAVLIRDYATCVWDSTPKAAVEKLCCLEAIAKCALSPDVEYIPMDADKCKAIYYDKKNRNSYLQQVDQKIPGTLVTPAEEKFINLALLEYFDKVCRENDIKYSLTGGTLLGAVRHKGLIPWDDDVDVFLSRPEFEKLRDAFPDGGRYVYVDRVKEPGYPYVFGRLIDTDTMIVKSPNTISFGKGLFVDVCVVDGLPKSKILREIHMKRMRILFRFRRATIHENNSKSYANKGPVVLFFKKVIKKCTTTEFWNRKIEKLMQKYPWDTSEYVGNFTSAYGKREMLHRSGFDSYSDMEFEGKNYMVFDGYEEYLTNIYRDYMQLPPVKKRVGHHPNTTYWVDRTEQARKSTSYEKPGM